MITRIPEAFIIATIISASLNLALALTIAGMAHSWGVTKGKLSALEDAHKVASDAFKKVTSIHREPQDD